jgi:NTP pyrophosphatase (non-canonical NTP hydrolase)
MDISEFQRIAKKFREHLNKSNPRQYNTAVELLADLTEEIGELAKSITRKEIRGVEPDHKIEDDVVDVLFSLFCFANHYKFDMKAEIAKVLKKWEERYGIKLAK